MKSRLLIFMLIVSVQLLFAQEKSDDWAQYYRYQEANEAITSTPEVVFMGNSITDMWATQRPEFFTNNNFVGRGISGQTSYEMLARFRSDVVNLTPKAVVILSGTNDVAENQGPITIEHTAENIFSMCDIARANNIIPIICSVVPCSGFRWREIESVAQKIIDLNTLLREYAKQNDIEYVDYHTKMANDSGGLNPELSYDGCHPTPYGYFVMEGVLSEKLPKVLNHKEPLFTYPQPAEL